MFAGYDSKNPSQAQIDVALAAHGMSIVQVQNSGGKWTHSREASANRRIMGTTPIAITGPAAGHEWMKTTDDPDGKTVLGTLNNCAGGVTPWGTVVSGEENFNQYFGNLNGLSSDDPRKAVHSRYGLTAQASERQWERFYDRFDIAKEPNEPFRFGWAVEIDPYDVNSVLKIEELMYELQRSFTIVIVTHNLQQAARVADQTVFLTMNPEMRAGFVVEAGPTQELFTTPKDKRTEDYLTGRFG
jgi:secreted PhoX family phosphatase